MNSIDAIFSILFLLVGLVIILGTLTQMENKISESGDSIFTKGLVFKCVAIFESANSNKIENFQLLNCYKKDDNFFAEFMGKRKMLKIINFDLVEHYGKGNDFFD